MRSRNLLIALASMLASACSGSGPQAKVDLFPKTNATIAVMADEFQPGRSIPGRNAASGGNISPTLTWSTVPSKTKSVTIIADDPDANGFVHWVVYNVSPETNKLPTGLPRSAGLNTLGSAMQGRNGAGSIGYFGPQPPPGRAHHYHFHVYALDVMLPLKPGASKADVVTAMSGHVLAHGELIGIYQRG